MSAISLRPPAGGARVGAVISAAFVLVCLALIAVGVLTGLPLTFVMLIVAAVLATVWHRFLLSWPTLVAGIALLIILVPIRHYELPGGLPIQLEPYRVVVAFLAVAWIASALIDPRVRLRGSVLIDRPLAIFLGVVLLSLAFNLSRVSSVGPDVVKGLLFFGSFVVVLFLVVSLLRRYADIERVVAVIVVGVAFVAVFAVFESHTGRNVFLNLERVIPILQVTGEVETLERGARNRAFGSAQHPIAMGAAFSMTIPLALALAVTRRQARWWLAAGLVMLGAVSTVSRTAIVMMIVVGLIFLWLRPKEVKRLWPLILPAVVAVHFALPGTLGTIKKSFFPTEGLIAQQQDAAVGSGRLATLGPALRKEFVPNPLFGEGFATRVTKPNPDVPAPNAPILDNQWLGILLETGLVGVLSLLWLFLRFIRRMGRRAKGDHSPRGWLLAGIAASVAAYGAGMFTFDAFSFIQVTFLLFIVIGLGCAALLSGPNDSANGNGGKQATQQDQRHRAVASGLFSRVAYRAPRGL